MRRKLIGATAGVVIVAALVVAVVNRGLCMYTGWQLDRETRYAAFVGCLVRTENGWLPLQQLRDIE